MKKLVLMVLAGLLSCTMVSMAFADGLQKGDVVYAKYGMRGKGKTIFWHNMSALPILVPAGSEVKIVGINAKKVVFTSGSNKYTLATLTSQWDKYFVKNMSDVDVSKAASGPVSVGMSKADVYLIKGCPAYIGYGELSNRHSLDEVFASNEWYYNVNSRLRDAVIYFDNGVVKSMADRSKKAKK